MKSRHEIMKAKAKLVNQNKAKKAMKHINAGLVLMAAGAVLSHVSANDTVVVQAQSSSRVSQSDFLGLITDYAKQIAAENDLYASVMIAQAALESGWGNSTLSKAPNYNLFGIKGEYNGNSVVKDTLEDDGSGEYYQIQDAFRRYDNYGESLTDYASLLTGDNDVNNWRYNFYSGARYSNTNSYQDATTHLTGRYATDTRYGDKLNRIIAENNLTQYDLASSDKPVSVVPSTPESNTGSNEAGSIAGTYTVKEGDGFWGIARRFGTTVEALKAANGTTSNLIHPGQVIKLPGNSTIVEKPSTPPTNSDNTLENTEAITSVGGSYTIKRGDGLYAIARKHGMTLNQLKSLNGLSSNLIHPGQVLKVSGATQGNTESSTNTSPNTDSTNTKPTEPTNNGGSTNTSGSYSVKAGDGLYRIAVNHGMSLNQLKALNGLSSNLIQPGQVLKVSGATTSTPASTVEANEVSQPTVVEEDNTPTTIVEPEAAPVVEETVVEETVEAPTNSSYTVAVGDTLFSIARRNGLNVNELIEKNNGSTTIFIGQTIGLN
ncbi:LysM peptidoglycan-binding domain-containing protein [Ruoffia tabacinasalis]|uniref:Peptidoglycan hydrolase n=1 Tax=Ruoffia tabacinasalis TaxID=87458 RepID=A0A5R9DVX8_9LACT|nr:LysM peptidoglycan-binding domain-containing protein [Ruoffia tabacinasalis]TLQ40229.1 LysM peptidoglycan-binding domain-containing protein [Ruoffia tabacinasalis]